MLGAKEKKRVSGTILLSNRQDRQAGASPISVRDLFR